MTDRPTTTLPCSECDGEGVVQPWGDEGAWISCVHCAGTGTEDVEDITDKLA